MTLREPKLAATNNPPVDRGPHNGGTGGMNADFDSGANDLWALYGKETKSRGEVRFSDLKDDMNSVFLLVRS